MWFLDDGRCDGRSGRCVRNTTMLIVTGIERRSRFAARASNQTSVIENAIHLDFGEDYDEQT